jgi:hypothetical protein
MIDTWEHRYLDELAEDLEPIFPEESHDFRDTTGDPMEKRDRGSASDWEANQQREHTPGLGRR